jgi:homoserine O-acetyltransferase
MSIGPDYKIPVEIPGIKYFKYNQPFELDIAGLLKDGIVIAYHTYGELNSKKDNVIWVCHALTANSNVADWWAGLFGNGKLFDPSRYFIVCANILGSCYGSTGPRSVDPYEKEPYGMTWPIISIRDWVRAHDLLRIHLGIEEIALCIGGSCGGHQVLEYACLIPDKIKHLGLLVTSARETAWVIAGHEAQRIAMQADPTLEGNDDISGLDGMRAARGMALLGYRNIEAYIKLQTDRDDVVNDHRASTYIRHQGEKLAKRFYPHCYWNLTKSLDTHHIGRGRGSIPEVLSSLKMKATIIGIDSDRLIPVSEQQYLADYMPNAEMHILHSLFGHDGFLIETGQILEVFR